MSEQRQNTSNDLQVLVFAFLLLFVLTIHIIARTQSVSSSGAAFHIVQSDGETPIAEVLVRLCLRGKVLFQTSSDSKGMVVLPALEVPDLTLEFTKSGFLSERLVGQKIANISDPIRLFQEGVFHGKVLTRKTSKPVAGARINLWGPGGRIPTITDREGHFYINQLRSGKYTLTLQADGFSVPSVEQMEIHGGQQIEREFRLQDGSLFTGKIIDKETNKPLKNIYIYLNGNHYYYDHTDEQGFFSFGNVEPGTYQIRVYHEGFKPLQSASVNIGEAPS
ncbi:MAG TPA: carboxypeptidase regulatory-like domain-containing protein, partial [Acidobacteriota bacterium]|nr:carboxypeptidase regulatory-like domain-containing protein [Acidobacteriota bacterium]